MGLKSGPLGDQQNIEEYKVTTLNTTVVALIASGARKLAFIHVDNSRNSAPTWLKFYDSAGSPTHAADEPAHVLKIPGGADGEIPCGWLNDVPASHVDFELGVHVAAADGPALTDGDPAAAFDVVIGVIA